MDVEVVLKSTLAGQVDTLPGGRGSMRLPDGATVGTLLETLGLPQAPYVAVVDGTAVRAPAPLHDGARVELHPPMAGG